MYQSPRGTADILPEDQDYWFFLEKKIVEITRLYGYERIETPGFEDSSLYTRSTGEYTDIVQKEMYTFEDRGGNTLSLKPEGTPSVCRAYIQHGLQNKPQPVKMYYLASIFRYDRPQAGRMRQHHQFGCEAIGDADPALDAEIIEIAWRLYKEAGLNNLSTQMNSIGCRKCRPSYLEALVGHYSGNENILCSDCKIRLVNNPLRLLDCKQTQCQNLADSAPRNADYLCEECREHLEQVEKYLRLLELPYELNHRLVRGLDYYSRTVFEVQPEDDRAQATIGGGGRYDYLIEELGGKPAPGVGFATGIERIIINMKKQGIEVPPLPSPKVLVAYIGDEAKVQAVRLTSILRKDGISVVNAASGKSLKAQLKQANTLGVSYTVILGDEEVRNGTAVLRNMTNASQETISFNKLLDHLK
ncbi:MAG: histidine--tRNA ligase [Chloroflexi bacterium RBG_13_46_14]|nr:MAG: histidine--tRNA ligase [Chloroflexi bacterium RBG_13_46_14]